MIASMLYPQNPITSANLKSATSWNTKVNSNVFDNPKRRPAARPLIKYDSKDVRYVYDKAYNDYYNTTPNNTWVPTHSQGSALRAVQNAILQGRNAESELAMIRMGETGNWKRLENPLTGVPARDSAQKFYDTVSSIKRRLDRLKLSPKEKQKLENIFLQEYAPLVAQFPSFFNPDTGEEEDSAMFLARMFSNSLTTPSSVTESDSGAVDTQKLRESLYDKKAAEIGKTQYNVKTGSALSVKQLSEIYEKGNKKKDSFNEKGKAIEGTVNKMKKQLESQLKLKEPAKRTTTPKEEGSTTTYNIPSIRRNMSPKELAAMLKAYKEAASQVETKPDASANNTRIRQPGVGWETDKAIFTPKEGKADTYIIKFKKPEDEPKAEAKTETKPQDTKQTPTKPKSEDTKPVPQTPKKRGRKPKGQSAQKKKK